ncbi:class I SAM-dependent RNA methyltransferase [Altererythrobacter sp. MF3-039]|uniref:class I SAM-dependent RNA methyltransferase n=1 Tax=Altererythrobacter sp. MF3-039 TaxID=3252901 RepID=UPI00390C4023
MSEGEPIVRIAARGDGVTADGKHVAGGAPQDRLLADGTLAYGLHHVEPPCPHFGKCGGCQLQHCDEEVLREFVTSRVLNAAASQGLEPAHVLPTHLSPPMSRRRATLHAAIVAGIPVLGFREEGSHKIVGMQECHILRPELLVLIGPLKKLLRARTGRFAADITLTLVDQGVDCAIKGLSMEGLEETEAMLDFARETGLARLTLDQGYGPEALWEPDQVTVTMSGVKVGFPVGSFLQATMDGEQVLVEQTLEWLGEAGLTADLFSGLGTFAFAMRDGRRVLAVEAARDAHLACKSASGLAGNTVHALHRDLFRNPLLPQELAKFEAVVLDPPRAGAKDQTVRLAESEVLKVIYVSCNPSSWARDAARLIEGGFRLEAVRPVGQFRWSTHVELVSLFTR